MLLILNNLSFQALEGRARKHEARQNEVLLRAVWRVWKAHERGRLVERVKGVRLLKRVWAIWVLRLRQEREREGAPVNLSLCPIHSHYGMQQPWPRPSQCAALPHSPRPLCIAGMKPMSRTKTHMRSPNIITPPSFVSVCSSYGGCDCAQS
jgi:hypothetical protein